MTAVRTVRRLRRCHCPASRTDVGRVTNWRLVKRHTYNQWVVRCLCCDATWVSDAKYTDRLKDLER